MESHKDEFLSESCVEPSHENDFSSGDLKHVNFDPNVTEHKCEEHVVDPEIKSLITEIREYEKQKELITGKQSFIKDIQNVEQLETNTKVKKLYNDVYKTKMNFIVEMMNNYTQHYKKISNKEKLTVLDGINFSDVTSTNIQLENFYEEMLKYKVNETTNPEYIKIYKYSEREKMKIYDELYVIIKDGEPLFLSTSMFSLLIELTNLKNENAHKNINFDIVSLK